MQTILLHPKDNVAIALLSLNKGTLLQAHREMELVEDVPAMHKIATRDIAQGEVIVKFNQQIGIATQAICAGEHVHSHNLEARLSGERAPEKAEAQSPPLVSSDILADFMGYQRSNGEVGTRNFIGIVTTVNCSATVAHKVAQACQRNEQFDHWENVDGVVALSHKTGCGMRDAGEGYETLVRTINGYMAHPNFGGVLVIGLGCEVLQVGKVMEAAGLAEGPLLRTLLIQETGGTSKTIARGIEVINEMLPEVNKAKRSRQPASALKVALQCGGSDAMSGVTVNPALGVAVDLLVSQGGTAILSETPEMYGAEHLLLQRAVNDEVRQKFLALLAWWEDYANMHGVSLDNNPSPGNKAGGLTTILEKSLGAQAKSGSAPLTGVYKYAEPITTRGIVFMDSPGFDPVSVTGQVASGANIVCFTTGRGSAFGFKPVPVIKLSSNSNVFRNQGEDIDINCGVVLEGEQTVQESGREIFGRILAVASGEKTCSEINGYGDNEFSPWPIGAVL